MSFFLPCPSASKSSRPLVQYFHDGENSWGGGGARTVPSRGSGERSSKDHQAGHLVLRRRYSSSSKPPPRQCPVGGPHVPREFRCSLSTPVEGHAELHFHAASCALIQDTHISSLQRHTQARSRPQNVARSLLAEGAYHPRLARRFKRCSLVTSNPLPFLNVVKFSPNVPVPGNFENFPSARANDELARSSDRADAVQHWACRAGFLNGVLFSFRIVDSKRYIPCQNFDSLRHPTQRGCACHLVEWRAMFFLVFVVDYATVNKIY